MKKIILLLLALVCFSTIAHAAAMPASPTAAFYVNDYAGVLSSKDAQAIATLGTRLESLCGAQVVAVTVNYFNGLSGDDYAFELFNKWGIGQKDAHNGVLLLFSVGDREVLTQIGQGIDMQLTPSLAMSLIDDHGMASFSSGNYSQGMANSYAALCERVASIYGVSLNASTNSVTNYIDYYAAAAPRRESGDGWLIWVIVIAVIFLVLSRQRRTYYRRGYGGGGFGGGFLTGWLTRGAYRNARSVNRPPMSHQPGSILGQNRPSAPKGFGGGGVTRGSGGSRSFTGGGSFGGGTKSGGFGGGGGTRGSGGGRKF